MSHVSPAACGSCGREQPPLSRRASGEVGEVVDAELGGDFAQACAAGGEEAAQEAAFVQFLDSGPPAFGG